MNEQLKIIISADTANAQKNIKAVSSDVKGLEASGNKTSKGFGGAMGKVGSAAAIAASIVVAAVGAMVGALTNLSKSTEEYRKEQAKLNTAFLAMGSTTAQAGKSFNDLYRFLGDSSKAVETAGHLAKLTTDEKALAEWTTNLQGVYATFGDSLPIEGLAEAANETARVGKVTGTLADALNWAGANEDAFNASLASCNSTAEREKLIRETLNGLYNDAALLYEKNNQEIIQQNEAQARLNTTLAEMGKVTTPLRTALSNLSNELLTALAPAIEVVANALTWLINCITKAIQYVKAFIAALTGKSTEATEDIADGMDSAAGGAGQLNNNLIQANKNAEKLKRTTAGFDELNIIANTKASSGGGSTSSGGGGNKKPTGGATIGTGLTDGLGEANKKVDEFATKVKKVFLELQQKALEYAQLFNPHIQAWSGMFEGLAPKAQGAWTSIQGSLTTLWENTLKPFTGYIMNEFVPNIVNSISVNLAPMFTDTLHYAIESFGTDFQWLCGQIETGVNDIITPSIQQIETVLTDTMDVIGKEWEESGGSLIAEFDGFKESIKSIWETLYGKILKPVWDSICTEVDGLWEKHLKGLWENIVDFFTALSECVMTIWNNFLGPLIEWIITVVGPEIVNSLSFITETTSSVFGIITDVISGVIEALGGLLKFITGVFSGDWNKAWEGIKQFFSGIWDAILGILKGIVNLIIDILNSLWRGLYAAVAGIVNGLGGIFGSIGEFFGADWGWEIPSDAPQIPKLAKGGIVDKATIAMIGEHGKEAVVPLENNTEWIDMLVEKLGKNNNTPTKIVLMLNEKELGWANINSINSITHQTGALQLSLV